MKGTPFADLVFRTTSWFIVFALLFSTVMLWVDPPGSKGPVTQLIGLVGAQIFYALLYSGEALSLAYAKLFKKNRWRKVTLLVTYLTGFFTSILTVSLRGWSPAVLDNLAIAVAAAGCWLYWTFRTEYLTQEEMERVFTLERIQN